MHNYVYITQLAGIIVVYLGLRHAGTLIVCASNKHAGAVESNVGGALGTRDFPGLSPVPRVVGCTQTGTI